MIFRASGQPQDSFEVETERLLLIIVRLLQDTPNVAITARKVRYTFILVALY